MLSPVPSFSHSLKALAAILTKTERYCSDRKIDPSVLMTSRLYPDMLPFTRQVLIACDNAKGASARLSGTEVPRYDDTETTIPELQARIQKTLDFIEAIPDKLFDGAEKRSVTLNVGQHEMTFPGAIYLFQYAIPNFYFHMTTAYDILRHNGVELGKRDFLGG